MSETVRTPMSPLLTRRQVPALTGLRGVAALTVFATHVAPLYAGTPGEHVAGVLGLAGNAGVAMFFVLSGYLLQAPSTLARGVGQYAVRRARRILPVYWCVLTGAIVLFGLFRARGGAVDLGWQRLVANALLMQSWLPQGMDASLVYPAWSLSVEVVYYAMLPFSFGVLERTTARRPALVLAVLLCASATAAAAIANGWCDFVFPPAYLPTFLLGGWMAVVLSKNAAGQRVPGARALAVLSLASFGAYVVTVRAGVQLPAFLFVGLPFAALVGRLATTGSTWLGSRTMERLGLWSYSFFLVHALVISSLAAFYATAGKSLAAPLALTVLALAVSVGVSTFLYRFVEVRLQL